MFICENCHKNQEHYAKPVQVVVDIRWPIQADNPKAWEIKREKKVCTGCAVELTGVDAREFIDNPTLLSIDCKKIMITESLDERDVERRFTPRPVYSTAKVA